MLQGFFISVFVEICLIICKFDHIAKVLDTTKKTIIHIPSVNSRASSGLGKYTETDEIIKIIGTIEGRDYNNGGIYHVRTKDGRLLPWHCQERLRLAMVRGMPYHWIKLANRMINIDKLSINLIDTINPFQRAYEILSKQVDARTLKVIQVQVTILYGRNSHNERC